MVNNQFLSQFHANLKNLGYYDLGNEVISVINYPLSVSGLSQSLRAVQNLIPFLKVVNPSNFNIWENWESGIPFLIKVAEDLEQEIVTKPLPEKRSRWLGKISTYKVHLLAAIEQPYEDASDSSYINPALAILLAASRLKIADQNALENLNRLSDFVRKAADGNSSNLNLLKQYIPPLTLSKGSSWLKAAQEIRKPKKSFTNTYRKTIPSSVNSIVYLYEKLWELEPKLKPAENEGLKRKVNYLNTLTSKDALNETPGGEVFLEASTKLSDEPTLNRQRRPRVNLFHQLYKDENLDVEGLGPLTGQIEVFDDVPADQPIPLVAIQSLDVRYTNYRTAMDNQRLPWSWDCLNKIEIAAIVEILGKNSLVDSTLAEYKIGHFLTWLMLLTGQNVKQILQINLVECPHHQSALMPGYLYRKYIQLPPYAFKPNNDQQNCLANHHDHLDLSLPAPYPHLMHEISLGGLHDSSAGNAVNISIFLGLSEESAEAEVREFLSKHRKRNMRLSIGRVQNVLASEVMAVSGDPVITHMLSAKPTDMPPSGVYYSSISEDHLRRIYDLAIKNILRING